MNNQINIIKKGRPKTIDLERLKMLQWLIIGQMDQQMFH